MSVIGKSVLNINNNNILIYYIYFILKVFCANLSLTA